MSSTFRTPASALVALAVFVVLAVTAHHAGSGTALDHSVTEWMVAHRDPVLTRCAVAITDLGSPVGVAIVAVAVSGLWWWRSGSLQPGAVVVVATLAAGALSTATKMVVGAHRPASAVQLVVETDPSFPSGHVTGTVALLGSITAVLARQGRRGARRLAVALTVFAGVVVALTRLYLGVHWLTDVAGGAALGGAVAMITYALCTRGGPPSGSDAPGRAASQNAPAEDLTAGRAAP